MDTRQHHDNYKDVNTDHLARPSERRGVPPTTTQVLLVFIRLGYLLSAARCRVGRQSTNAGVVSLGGSLRLVAAERPH